MSDSIEFTLSVDQLMEINEQFYYPKAMALVLVGGVMIMPFLTVLSKDGFQLQFAVAVWISGGICAFLCVGMYWVVNRRNVSRIRQSSLKSQRYGCDSSKMYVESEFECKFANWADIRKVVLGKTTIVVFTKRGMIIGLPYIDEIVKSLKSHGCIVRNGEMPNESLKVSA